MSPLRVKRPYREMSVDYSAEKSSTKKEKMNHNKKIRRKKKQNHRIARIRRDL